MHGLSLLVGSLTALSSVLVGPVAAMSVDCGRIRASGVSWDFSDLDQKYSLAWYHPAGESGEKVLKTTFDFNICQPMANKGLPKSCPSYSHICGVADRMDEDGGNVEEAVATYPIAVAPINGGGKNSLDPKWTRLKGSASHDDSEKHGVRLELHGQKNDIDGVRQMAIIEFQCLKKDKRSLPSSEKREDGDDDNKDDGDGDGDADKKFDEKHPEWAKEREISDGQHGTIKFHKFGTEELEGGNHAMVLRLVWDTPFACEDSVDDPDSPRSKNGSGWGFFSWLFFLSFMGIIAYFSFFAWINYTRYGKSGLDMLPHADTLRELPQLLGEYIGKIINTLRGGRASGGYSAL